MADFVAVLRKTVGALGENTPEMREMVYDKARATIEAKLAAINPPPPAAVVERQRQALEDAITVLRGEYDDAPPAEDEDDLEDIFASLSTDPAPEPSPAVTAPVIAAERKPAAAEPAPAPPPAAAKPSPREEAPVKPMPRAVDPIAELDAVEAGEHPARERRETAVANARARQAAAKPRGRGTGLVAALLLLAVLAGGGYAVWVNKDDFSRLVGLGPAGVEPAGEDAAAVPAEDPPAASEDVATSEQDQEALEEPPAETAAAEPTPEAQQEPAPEAQEEVAALPSAQEQTPAQSAASEVEKFTQRLLPDGREVDEGPAGGERSLGEGTSVAAVAQPQPAGEPAAAATDTQPATAEAGAETAQAEETAPATTPAVAVGQRAIFYEERTSSAQGSAESGSIVWSTVQESPGGDLPPEPAIRAEAIIPGKDVQLRMTIRRNGDQTLPAAHIVEMIFLTPENFEGGGISNVSRISFKETEQAAGNPLLGIPAKIADGFFLIALGDSPAEIEANTTLLRRQSWVDIPIVYQSGRRALLSLEKGIPGDRVFQDVLRAWSDASSG